MAVSNSEIRRMIAQRAVKVENFVVENEKHPINITSEISIQIGNRIPKTIKVADFLAVKVPEERNEN